MNLTEYSIYSQNGEDGVIDSLFSLLGTDSRYFVEFGAYDGKVMSNTRLLKESGWQGLMLDGEHHHPEIGLYREWITAENINALFAKYCVPYNCDLISIDCDFNDFYLWQALSNNYCPRVVVIEYNATHAPHEDKVVAYKPYYQWDGTNYFGASFHSLVLLGREKGYRLVYAESKGGNLFFVRQDLIEERDVMTLYRPPGYGVGGHPADPFKRSYLRAADLLTKRTLP